MTALDLHNLGEGDIRTAHAVQVLPRVLRHITGRNAEGKSVFLSTDDDNDDHHHRELVNKSASATIIYSTVQHPVELEYAHENEVRTSQPLCTAQTIELKAKHSLKSPWRTDWLAAWLISLQVAHHQCGASTVLTALS